MPQQCCVTECRSRYDKTSGISFHCFPKQGTIREHWLMAIGLETLNWDAKPRVCSRHFTNDDFIIGGNVRKLKKCAIPNTSRLRLSCGDNQDLPTLSSKVTVSTPACCSLSKEQSHAGDNQLNTFTSSTPKKVFTNKTMQAANNFPLNMTWTSKENAKAGKKSTSRRSPPLQKSTSHGNIFRNETSSGNMLLEICKSSCSKTIEKLENKITYLSEEVKRLQESVQPKALFNLEKFSNNDKKILYYTGFQTYQLLMLAFDWILPGGDVKHIAIHVKSKETVRQHLNKLTARNQYFLTLVRLRRGMAVETLEDLFSISKSSVDNIFLCWINLIYLRLGCLDIWPNRDILISRASDLMKAKYPNVIGSLICTEFFIQRPSSLQKQSQCYSNYEGATTLKSLIMIEPGGAIIYASPLFTGSISDKGIIEASGFLDILKEKVDKGQILPGDVILADKGFNVIDLFQAVKVNINIPVFKISGSQFTSEEVVTTRNIAKDRIHVECAIGRLKTYKILCSPIPIVSLGTMEQIYTVCVLLCNFRYGSIKQNKNDMSHIEINVPLT